MESEKKIGLREASVLRYKEKRQNRLFSKRIRYEVRKLNAQQRPRMKVAFSFLSSIHVPPSQLNFSFIMVLGSYFSIYCLCRDVL